MRYSFFNSLKVKIAFLFTFLIAIAFGINLSIAIYTLKNEKVTDLQKVLSHAVIESMDEYMPSNTTDKTDISYLYEIPHNISILDDSEADSVKFTITKNPHIQADGEIAHSARLENGYYLNCISSDSKIKQALLKYAEKLLVRYFIFLLVILSITLYFVQKLMRPLGTLVLKCKQYRDNDNFFVEKVGCHTEICAVADAFAALVSKLENYRKREKELFREAAHELKTPLALMRARLDVYQEDDNYQKEKFSEELGQDIERLSSELRNVLFFEISDFEDNSVFDICILLSEVVSKMDILTKRRQITIATECEKLQINTKKTLFRKLIAALIENAITYAKEESTVKINLDSWAQRLCIKNEKGDNKYMFSSKVGERILKRVTSELGLNYEIIDMQESYEIYILFSEHKNDFQTVK